VRHTIPIGPGARFDVLLDLPQQEGQKIRLILRGETELPDAVALEFLTQGAARPAPVPPPARTPIPCCQPKSLFRRQKDLKWSSKAARKKPPPAGFKPKGEDLRRIWKINGRASSGIDGPPLFSVKKGQVVTLGLVNASLFPLVLHVQAMSCGCCIISTTAGTLIGATASWCPTARPSMSPSSRTIPEMAVMSAIQEHFASGLAGWFEVA